MKEGSFVSPTIGQLSYERLVEEILSFVAEDTDSQYKLIIGTDSHSRDDSCFVTAIIIHRQGKGARYFYQRRRQYKITSLRQKIFYETAISLVLAQRLVDDMISQGLGQLDVEIHLDVGYHGPTRDLIREVVGMVVGSGFHAEIKPASYGASKVADRYTK